MSIFCLICCKDENVQSLRAVNAVSSYLLPHPEFKLAKQIWLKQLINSHCYSSLENESVPVSLAV